MAFVDFDGAANRTTRKVNRNGHRILNSTAILDNSEEARKAGVAKAARAEGRGKGFESRRGKKNLEAQKRHRAAEKETLLGARGVAGDNNDPTVIPVFYSTPAEYLDALDPTVKRDDVSGNYGTTAQPQPGF